MSFFVGNPATPEDVARRYSCIDHFLPSNFEYDWFEEFFRQRREQGLTSNASSEQDLVYIAPTRTDGLGAHVQPIVQAALAFADHMKASTGSEFTVENIAIRKQWTGWNVGKHQDFLPKNARNVTVPLNAPVQHTLMYNDKNIKSCQLQALGSGTYFDPDTFHTSPMLAGRMALLVTYNTLPNTRVSGTISDAEFEAAARFVSA